MAEKKKMVEAITSRDEDFAKWYTDIVKKAELVDYSNVKGCMVIRPITVSSNTILEGFIIRAPP